MPNDLNSTSWSQTDGANNSPAPLGWPSGMKPNTVEPTAQAMMGAMKRAYDHMSGTLNSSGATSGYILTYAVAPQALVQGDPFVFRAHKASAAADTLNVNGLGAFPLYEQGGSAPVAIGVNDIQIGQMVTAIFDLNLAGGSGGFQVLDGALAATFRNLLGISFSTGDMIYFTGGNLNRLPVGTVGQGLYVSGGLPVWQAVQTAGLPQPTVSVLNTSGSYIPPNGTTHIFVRIVGGGGGGAGGNGGTNGSVSGGTGGNGGNSSFGGLTANGGTGGTATGPAGGAGGNATGGDINIGGQGGGNSQNWTVVAGENCPGSTGGDAGLGLGLGGQSTSTGAGGAPSGFGGGGGGGFTNNGSSGTNNAGSGGGGGGATEKLIAPTTTSYTYVVGASGAAGAAGGTGNTGGTGARGTIIIHEFYN